MSIVFIHTGEKGTTRDQGFWLVAKFRGKARILVEIRCHTQEVQLFSFGCWWIFRGNLVMVTEIYEVNKRN